MVDLVPTASLRNDLQLLTTLDGGAVKAFSDISMQIFRQGMQKTKGFSGAANWQRVLDLLSCFGRGRTLRTLAERLGVTTDTIKAMCRALCHVMLEAARSEPSEAALGEYLHELGFTGAAREVLVAFHVQNGAEVRERGLALDLQVPHFKDLQWRLDVQVASRSLQNEASPSFLLSVATETKEGTVEEHLMHADYATVLRLKHQVEQALKEATSLDTRRLMRHVKLAK